MPEPGSTDKYNIEKWGNNEAHWYTPLPQHKKIKHEKENRSQKEGLKKKRATKNQKKKKHTMEPVHCHSDRFFCHIIPSFFIRNAFDLLGFLFPYPILISILADVLHRTIKWSWTNLYRVFVSVPALGRQLVDSQAHLGIMVFRAQSPAHLALGFSYLHSSALCIQPDLVSLFSGCSLVCFFALPSIMSRRCLFPPYIFVTYSHWTCHCIAAQIPPGFYKHIVSTAIAHIAHDKKKKTQ